MTKEEMSKDEILRNRVGLIPYLSLEKSLGQIRSAMDEYAKQEAIAYVKWAIENNQIKPDGFGYVFLPGSEENVYDQFIEQQNK